MEETKEKKDGIIQFSPEEQETLLREVIEETARLKGDNDPKGAVVFIPDSIMDKIDTLKYSLRKEKITKKHLIAAILKVFFNKVSGATAKELQKMMMDGKSS